MILALIFAFFNFLFSIWGVATLLTGVVIFLLLPVISAVSRFKSFAGIFLMLAALPIRRAAFVVSEHNDILFKQMQFDGLGVERIKIDGEDKLFEDPDAALHHWRGMTFALADEEHGVLFDPRHAAAGKRKKQLDNEGRDEYQATDEEWSEYGISIWKPGVFSFPDGVHELVDLSAVQHIIDGGERSEFPERVEELYQHSRAPLESGNSTAQYLMPVIAFCMTFGGIWLLASQIGGPDSTVQYFIAPPSGLLSLLPFLAGTSVDDEAESDGENVEEDENNSRGLLGWLRGSGGEENKETGQREQSSDPLGDPPEGGNDGADEPDDRPGIADRILAIDWALIAGLFLLAATPLAVAAGLIVFLGPIYGSIVLFTLLLGMALLPILTFLVQPSILLGGLLSTLYFKLGFLGYRKPVLEWTREKYRLREFDQLETTDDVTWYDGFGGLLGFSFAPSTDSWDAEVVPHSTIEAANPDRSRSSRTSTRIADGGVQANSLELNTNLPPDVFSTDLLKRDKYGGYLPNRTRDSEYYLHSGILLNRFANSAIGEKSQRKLLEAKEEYGTANEGIADTVIFKATLLMGLLGAVLGIAIFILPAFM